MAKSSLHPVSDNRPQLSVIVPVYGVERYLRECLDSIVRQTLGDLQIIVVNDCSPDASAAIIHEYLEKDPRFVYVEHQENLGLGGARNTGLVHASGHWVAFVDSDDRLEPNCYASALALIDRYGADGAVFGVAQFDDETGNVDRTGFPYNVPFANPTKFGPDVPYYNIIGPTVWNRVFRTSDLKSHELSFPEHLKHEDEEFTFKYVAAVEPLLVHDDEQGYFYRQRTGSIMHSAAESRLDLSKILLNILGFLQARGILERYRGHLISKTCEYLGYFATSGGESELPEEFASDLKRVVEVLDISKEELDRLPPYFVALYITDADALASFLSRELLTCSSAQDEEWLRFGRLPRTQKLRYLLERSVVSGANTLRR